METDQLNACTGIADGIGTFLMNIKQNAYYLSGNAHLVNVLCNEITGSNSYKWEQIGTTFSITTGAPTVQPMQSAYATLLLDPQFPLARYALGSFSLENGSITRQRVYSAIDAAEEEWYRQTVNMKGQIYAFIPENNTRNAYFAHQLRSSVMADPRYNENIGVVLYSLPQSKILSILTNAKPDEDVITVLMDENGVFLSTDSLMFPNGMSWEDMPDDMSKITNGGAITTIRLNNTEYMACSVVFQGNWRSVCLIPSSVLIEYISTPLPMLFLIMFIFLLVATLLSFSLSRSLAGPVVQLSNVMTQVQETRHLPPPIAVPDSQDEIEALYRSYNSMIAWIQNLSRQALEEAEKLRRSELKAMQAQINPHFIYNTLDSVSCNALMEGNDDIVVMVTSLISILKYTVNFTRTTVPLREEIDYLRHYVRIQQLRYKTGFEFTCDVPDKYLQVRVSQIIFQPLVENALFHAQSSTGPLKICLKCTDDHGQVYIHVMDNGTSGDAQALNNLLESDEQIQDSHGIGIRNVNRRIQLIIGGQSCLHYEQLPNGGLDAVIQVPYELIEEENR